MVFQVDKQSEGSYSVIIPISPLSKWSDDGLKGHWHHFPLWTTLFQSLSIVIHSTRLSSFSSVWSAFFLCPSGMWGGWIWRNCKKNVKIGYECKAEYLSSLVQQSKHKSPNGLLDVRTRISPTYIINRQFSVKKWTFTGYWTAFPLVSPAELEQL